MSSKRVLKPPTITWNKLGCSGYGGFIYGSNPEGYALHGYRDEDEDDETADYEIFQDTINGGSEQVGNVSGLKKAKAFVQRHAQWTIQLQKK